MTHEFVEIGPEKLTMENAAKLIIEGTVDNEQNIYRHLKETLIPVVEEKIEEDIMRLYGLLDDAWPIYEDPEDRGNIFIGAFFLSGVIRDTYDYDREKEFLKFNSGLRTKFGVYLQDYSQIELLAQELGSQLRVLLR